MEVPAPTQSPSGPSSPKGTQGRLWFWVGLTIVALVAGVMSLPYVASTQTPATPPSPSPPTSAGAGAAGPYITVYGEVKHQGRYDFVTEEMVGGAILRVGGFSTKAKDKAVKVVRKVPGKGNVTIVVNLRDVFSGKAPGKDIPLIPGDTVIVEEKLINF